jgi:hypothetical protein
MFYSGILATDELRKIVVEEIVCYYKVICWYSFRSQ